MHDYSGCPRDGPIAGTDMHGCLKYELKIWGVKGGNSVISMFKNELYRLFTMWTDMVDCC